VNRDPIYDYLAWRWDISRDEAIKRAHRTACGVPSETPEQDLRLLEEARRLYGAGGHDQN
jgi:hypothetical protein